MKGTGAVININALSLVGMLFFCVLCHGQNKVYFEYTIRSNDLSNIVFPCPSNICDSSRVADMYDSIKYDIAHIGEELHIYYNSKPSIQYNRNGSCMLNTLRKRYEKDVFTHMMLLWQLPDTVFVHSLGWTFVFKKENTNRYKIIDYSKSSNIDVDSITVLYYFERDSILRTDNYRSHTTCLRRYAVGHNDCMTYDWENGELYHELSLGQEKGEKRTIFVFTGMEPEDIMKIEDEYNECNDSRVRHSEPIKYQ